jgi:hypothetical protein
MIAVHGDHIRAPGEQFVASLALGFIQYKNLRQSKIQGWISKGG